MNKKYVLDTNVLLSDPESLFKFQEHEVILPITVIEELDDKKKDQREIGRNARQVARYLNEYLDNSTCDLKKGVVINEQGGTLRIDVRYTIETCNVDLPLDYTVMDNRIMNCAYINDATIITRDTNLRIKSAAYKIPSEDYRNDRVEVDDNFTGVGELGVDSEVIDQIYKDKFVSASGYEEFAELFPNKYLRLFDMYNDKHAALVKYNASMNEFELLVTDEKIMGLEARNMEQHFALAALCDPEIRLVSLIGKAGCGKAQPLDALVLTPTGFKEMGSLVCGDSILTPSGDLAEIINIFPQGIIDIYSVKFSDGTTVECCEDHLWDVKTVQDRNYHRDYKTVPLKDMFHDIIKYKETYNPKFNYSIPMVSQCVDINQDIQLPIDPYLLGVLLGDGSITHCVGLSSADSFIVDKCSDILTKYSCILNKNSGEYGYNIITDSSINHHKRNIDQLSSNPIKDILLRLGLYGCGSETKFIPKEFLNTTFENRLRLIHGLMDTDGFISSNGMSNEYYSVSKELAYGMKFLVESIGGSVTLNLKENTYYKDKNNINIQCLPCYRLYLKFPSNINPFSLPRKASRYKPKSKYKPIRYITSIEYIGKKKAQCIAIDHPSHLYITNNFIVTHNTITALAAGLHGVTQGKEYKKLLVYRPVVPMGNDIGYLPKL